MLLQLWSSARAPAYGPRMDSLDERCLLSARVVIQLSHAIGAPVDVGGAPALVAFTIPVRKPGPSGGVAKAASPPLSHNPGASSAATNGAAGSTSSVLANSAGATVWSITDLVPNLFATPLMPRVAPVRRGADA